MAYTPQTIHSHDPITVDWGNKVEQHLGRLGNYMGVVNTEAELPENSAIGDWYMVLDKGQIYLWNGEKWVKVGASKTSFLQNTLSLTLYDTSNHYNDEVPNGDVDGTNTAFTLLHPPLWSNTLSLKIDDENYIDDGEGNILQKFLNETPSGTIDGTNTTFTLANTPVRAGSVVLTVDENTTVTDNGDGTLSDGGTINYDTGEFTLANAPSSSLTADYATTTVMGSVDYENGSLELVNAPNSSIYASYAQKYWDGVKYALIPMYDDYPTKIEAFVWVTKTAGRGEVVARIYNENDELLIDATPQTLLDGTRFYLFSFDVSTLSRPQRIACQIELMCDADIEGTQDIIEVRWY